MLFQDQPVAKDSGTTAAVGRRKGGWWPGAKGRGKGRVVQDCPSTTAEPRSRYPPLLASTGHPTGLGSSAAACASGRAATCGTITLNLLCH